MASSREEGHRTSLFGVVGRKAEMVPNFHYSEANKGSGLTWDEATLGLYPFIPRAVVPGATMQKCRDKERHPAG